MSDTNQTPNAGGEARRDVPIAGHNYDGIREYDNPMPGWWVWLFWASVAFAPFYALGVHVFGYFDTYEEDLADGQAALMEVRHAYAEAHPTFEVDEETLASFVENPSMAEAGAAHYAAQCAACHGQQGQGLIGPNMTDAYWLYGGTDVDVYNVISNGVLEKGMPAWDAMFSPEERAELVAFIRSIQGTDPPGAKEPQGDLVQP